MTGRPDRSAPWKVPEVMVPLVATHPIQFIKPEDFRAHEARVLSEMKTLGGTVAALGESEADVEFKSGIPESVRGVLYLPILQLMAFYRSVAKGLNPDHPKNLTAVVRLNL